jgi:hypothetical protein
MLRDKCFWIKVSKIVFETRQPETSVNGRIKI